MASSLPLWLLSYEDPKALPGLFLTHTLNQTSLPVPAGSVPCCRDLPAYDTLSILTLNLCPTPSGPCLHHHHPITKQSRGDQNTGAQLRPHAQYYPDQHASGLLCVHTGE